MTVIDVLFRVDSICKKYQRNDVEKQRELNAHGDDAFGRLYAFVEAEIDAALQARHSSFHILLEFLFFMSIAWLKSGTASGEMNRAIAVAMNAEVRRTKARLMEEVPKLQKLAQKRVKGVSSEDQAIRCDLVLALPERIQAIPDATIAIARQSGGWATSGSHKNIKFDSPDGDFDSNFFLQSEASSQFRHEYEMQKLKQASFAQDQGLDFISEGEDTLKNLAQDMNECITRGIVVLLLVDRATSDLKNTNVRLKETLVQLRSSRNFCIDIVLLCVLLGVASFLYK
ncbi:hypothetical protein HS088_TW02G00550 [Tripterygium wilfordii]|uniref:t-SNARE coiled-coil homology domain-containing protein n=1 Tax=Tripterygium wilfordii TaxID=458696 RepID=A0A7J7DYT0_TRIWF|nr:hypothetical protein HS088_TW02G00550 [Tripterygium wilfordii]